MKLNLKKIQEVEMSYKNDTISIMALQRMVEIVMTPMNPIMPENISAFDLAVNTLTDLGIIDDEKIKKSEQLNS